MILVCQTNLDMLIGKNYLLLWTDPLGDMVVKYKFYKMS